MRLLLRWAIELALRSPWYYTSRTNGEDLDVEGSLALMCPEVLHIA